MHVPGKGCRRVALVDSENRPVQNVREAQMAFTEVLKRKDEGELPASRRSPFFRDYIQHYRGWLQNTNAKDEKTIRAERCLLNSWVKFIGGLRLTQISLRDINDYASKRRQQELSPRTVNLGVICLSNCPKHAKKEGWFPAKLPTEGWEPLSYKPKRRPLFDKEELEHFCSVATQRSADGEPKYRNGEMLADAVRFMSASGARVTSALATQWSDVDWENKQLHLHKTKYNKHIVVDFNPQLTAVFFNQLRHWIVANATRTVSLPYVAEA
jgi:integrase